MYYGWGTLFDDLGILPAVRPSSAPTVAIQSDAIRRHVRVRLSPSEYARLRRAAELRRQSLTDFVRRAIHAASADCLSH